MKNKGTYVLNDPQSVFLEASQIIVNAIEHTLGKDGMNTAIPTANSYLSIINDGKTIMQTLSSDKKEVQLALNTLKESSFATNQNAGDGTTSTAVLQHQLLHRCLNTMSYTQKHMTRPGEKLEVDSATLVEARDKILNELPSLKKDIKTREELLKVILVALGNDIDLAKVVYDAFEGDLSKPVRPALTKSNNETTTITRIDGVSLTPVEINPVVLANMPQVMDEELNVLIINQSISRLDSGLINILQRITESKRKTILLYTEIMPSVMDQLLFNIQEGSLHLIPIRLAYPITKIKDYVHALSKYFDAPVFDDLHQYQTFERKDKLDFGTATGYVINKDSAVIKGANQKYEFDYLPSKSSLIQVGFVTYSKQEEDYRRLEDAIHSAYNALTSGYTIGSGYTLLTLSHYLYPKDNPKMLPIIDALSYLFNKLQKESGMTVDAYIDYCSNNVYDSYKVTQQVILNAFTVVAQVLSTKCMLVPYE